MPGRPPARLLSAPPAPRCACLWLHCTCANLGRGLGHRSAGPGRSEEPPVVHLEAIAPRTALPWPPGAVQRLKGAPAGSRRQGPQLPPRYGGTPADARRCRPPGPAHAAGWVGAACGATRLSILLASAAPRGSALLPRWLMAHPSHAPSHHRRQTSALRTRRWRRPSCGTTGAASVPSSSSLPCTAPPHCPSCPCGEHRARGRRPPCAAARPGAGRLHRRRPSCSHRCTPVGAQAAAGRGTAAVPHGPPAYALPAPAPACSALAARDVPGSCMFAVASAASFVPLLAVQGRPAGW